MLAGGVVQAIAEDVEMVGWTCVGPFEVTGEGGANGVKKGTAALRLQCWEGEEGVERLSSHKGGEVSVEGTDGESDTLAIALITGK